MMMAKTFQFVCVLICFLAIIINIEACVKENATSYIDQGYYVEKTVVHNAVSKGAVCLDGSPPAYHFEPGFGDGVGKWLVHLSGGAWCTTVEECLNRSKSDFGSSNYMKPWWFQGIYSKTRSVNPDFYNWNKVFVRYCDGGAFTGNAEYVDPATNLHFRGARIFKAVMEDVLAKGLKNAQSALLIGSSAAGYPAMLYCDRFHKLLPNTPRVKCMVDAGYFIHVKDPHQARNFTEMYKAIVNLHGSAKTLPKSCTKKMKPEMCFFPENMQHKIKTPLYIAMSAFDKFQINTTIYDGINTCIEGGNCTATENKLFREFRLEFLNALPKGNNPKLRGAFIDARNHHTQVQGWWSPKNVTTVKNLNLMKAFADWYYDRNYTYVIDERDLPISAMNDIKPCDTKK
ncbi:PREDICTED: pectin acetylesterase 7-like isoform X2 [Nicotiana attenuata]|uniref:Pectin acetylesterase n=1 Tax=Nicotiana attenuata TaxID=49451 RepID=A0A1J6KDH9_NICAT|nr:PREDICTED: pectin acetylesterase 7-like isoform X2 [Nicotiana attenuata]OIT28141.1 pectin acetylesterase 8 [Nicotiana attenuata]